MLQLQFVVGHGQTHHITTATQVIPSQPWSVRCSRITPRLIPAMSTLTMPTAAGPQTLDLQRLLAGPSPKQPHQGQGQQVEQAYPLVRCMLPTPTSPWPLTVLKQARSTCP